MHEKALFKDLMRKIDTVARQESAPAVTGIVVRLGPFSHLTPDHFMEHFEWESRGTVAEGAQVRFGPWDEADAARADGIVLESVDVAVAS
jgi:hydrogenase nickel incorporation protein HypA/HybF